MFNLRSRFVRLALIMTILPAVIILIVGHISASQFDRQLENEIENQINDDVASLVEIYADQGTTGLAQSIQIRIKMTSSERGVSYYELTNPAGSVLAGNVPLSDLGVRVRQTNLKGGETLSVGRSLNPKNAAINALKSLFFKATLLSVLIGFGAGAISAGIFKRRLRNINAVCQAVADGDVTLRLSEDLKGDEISQLSGNINFMLARIQNLIGVRKRISDQVAHELRTPLTQLDSVLQDAEETTKDAQPIRAAREELKACVTLLDALLDVSSLEAQSGDKSDFEVFDLSELARDMCEFYEALALEKKQILTYATGEACEVEGDKTQIGRLIANLIDNAIKYTPQKGTISVSTIMDGNQVVLSVSDSGPGVALENRESVFAPFFRNRNRPPSAGHGLGLALVKAIADRHNGRLEIQDTSLEGGACFKFSIAAQSKK